MALIFQEIYGTEYPVLPLNLMEDIAKPLSLAIRLFGNTFGKRLSS